ncbi:MAG TPA: M55 family metallopeptidase [Acidobacteriota bacterium]|nr:M55 family metallopeptidase [Acidobacteriota bacterium]
MKKFTAMALCLIFILWIVPFLQGAEKELKVFISVDMEGVCGVIHWEEVSRNGKDYDLFRKLMTEETNAAIQGALAAGATEILVRDSHGSARNILPHILHPKAELIRDWSGGPLSMMEGIDESFDAVIFIGYHARANTPNAVLDHTMSGTLYGVTVNGKKMPEAGINALIAGHFGVPVVLVAGDAAVCRQTTELLGNVKTAAVKQGIGESAKMMSPPAACDLIRQETEQALHSLKDFKPYKLTSPYTMEVTFKDQERAENASWIPGAKRTSATSVSFTSSQLMEVLKFFKFAR